MLGSRARRAPSGCRRTTAALAVPRVAGLIERARTTMQEPAPPIPLKPPRTRRRAPDLPDASSNGDAPLSGKPKVKKLRLALVLLGLAGLALMSTIFGMMMAV